MSENIFSTLKDNVAPIIFTRTSSDFLASVRRMFEKTGARIHDISDPEHPEYIEMKEFPNFPRLVITDGTDSYVANKTIMRLAVDVYFLENECFLEYVYRDGKSRTRVMNGCRANIYNFANIITDPHNNGKKIPLLKDYDRIEYYNDENKRNIEQARFSLTYVKRAMSSNKTYSVAGYLSKLEPDDMSLDELTDILRGIELYLRALKEKIMRIKDFSSKRVMDVDIPQTDNEERALRRQAVSELMMNGTDSMWNPEEDFFTSSSVDLDFDADFRRTVNNRGFTNFTKSVNDSLLVDYNILHAKSEGTAFWEM